MITITARLKTFMERIFSVRTSQTNSCFENIDAVEKNGSDKSGPFSFNKDKKLQAIHGGLSSINYRLKSPQSLLTQNSLGNVVYQNLYAVANNENKLTLMRKNLSKKFFTVVLTVVSLFFVNAAMEIGRAH